MDYELRRIYGETDEGERYPSQFSEYIFTEEGHGRRLCVPVLAGEEEAALPTAQARAEQFFAE